MPRRNGNRKARPQAVRRADGTKGRRTPPPPPVEALVMPRGRCFHRSRNGKLRFAAADVERALKQAQAKRQRVGSGRVEQRAYHCADGCGDFHLTSRETYVERGVVS